MLLFIRYTEGLGDTGVYTRLRDSSGNYWNFTALTWDAAVTTPCKVFLYETQDADDSLYSNTATIPAGGPWIEETVLNASGRVIGYDTTTGVVDSEALNLKQSLFGYIGNALNVFSKVQGSFVGTLDFYVCTFANFSANMANPTATQICSLSSASVMTNVTNIATSGEVLFFKFSTSVAFSCLADTIVNIYNDANKGNIRCYVPVGAQYVAAVGAYYPTLDSGLLVYEGGNLISFGETAYGKSLAMIPGIDWTRISQPVQLTTTTVVV